MEKGKRAAPKNELIKKLSSALKADLKIMFDLADISKKNNLNPDIEEYIIKTFQAYCL